MPLLLTSCWRSRQVCSIQRSLLRATKRRDGVLQRPKNCDTTSQHASQKSLQCSCHHNWLPDANEKSICLCSRVPCQNEYASDQQTPQVFTQQCRPARCRTTIAQWSGIIQPDLSACGVHTAETSCSELTTSNIAACQNPDAQTSPPPTTSGDGLVEAETPSSSVEG